MEPFGRTIHKRRLADIMQDEGMVAASAPAVRQGIRLGLDHQSAGRGSGNIFSQVQGGQEEGGGGGVEGVPTGLRFVTDGIMRWIRTPQTFMRRVLTALDLAPGAEADAVQLAEDVKVANNSNLRIDVGRQLGEALRAFDAQFMLFELDGSFNMNIDGDTISANAGGTLFSMEFIDSLRVHTKYHGLPNSRFISTATIIALCRCPAVLVSSDLMLGCALDMITMSPVQEHFDRNRQFELWYNENEHQPVRSDQFKAQMNRLMLVYSYPALVRRAIMLVKSQLIPSDCMDPREKEILHDFFDMDFSLWVAHITEEHMFFPDNAKEEAKGLFRSTMRPVESVERCVYDILTTESSLGAEESVKYEAQRQDLYYANLVHGAAVRVPLSDIWCAHNELEHSDRDSGKFFDVMWKSLRDVLKTSLGDRFSDGGAAAAAAAAAQHQRRASDFVDALVKSVRRMKDTKSLMKELWEQSQEFRVSDRVHMVEIQILQRLKRDGIFPYLDRSPDAPSVPPRLARRPTGRMGFVQNMHLCFYMRRYACACRGWVFAHCTSTGKG